MDLREEFVKLVMSREYSLSSLCCEFGLSRKTGYKWLYRFRKLGRSGLGDRSRALHHHPNAVSAEIEEEIVCCRCARSQWGPLKLKGHLERIHPNIVWPAASTIGAILKRHGLAIERKVRRRADFKGWFRAGDGQRCDHRHGIPLSARRVRAYLKNMDNVSDATCEFRHYFSAIFWCPNSVHGTAKIVQNDVK
ncbi:MAG: helix-turn-helix domain-containing protein [Candidatus Zixiibacteriota bacterium]